MKIENRRHVLNIISRQPVSRIAVARETKLAQATITEITNELLEEKIIRETGKGSNATVHGRKPVTLDINPAWGYIAGISIDHEGFEIGILSVDGNMIGSVTQLEYMEPSEKTLDCIVRETKRLIEKNNIDPALIIGVGAIAPGPVDSENGIILNPAGFGAWNNFNLKRALSERLPYRIMVQHNSTAFTLMEHRLNLSKYGNFALFAVNMGIGFGLTLNEQVYTNTKGFGCEIGHMSIDINGRLCGCGNRGCLEMYATTKAILYDIKRVRSDINTWQEFIDKAHDGDIFCLKMIDMHAQYLAHSIINLNNLLELNAVIITGMGAYRGELLLECIRKHVYGNILSKNRRVLIIKNSAVTENIGAISAGYVVIDRLFSKDLYSEVITERKRT
ncbi:MAG: ROK family protein [Oscillospiraceae bacterium]|nr:ROK family protein [Oscillospiraceae bacterium]